MPNFVFVRHGYSCTNAMKNLVESNIIKASDGRLFLKPSENVNVFNSDIQPLDDPVLTNLGVDASIHNGCVINKILKNLGDNIEDERFNIKQINIIGCSPLIRSMETAYYMSRKWINPPNKIYVLPLLREIDESSDNKYSGYSRSKINLVPGYSMKSISEQKSYLKQLGILEFFDFSFVEAFSKQRLEPGDIRVFLNWFANYFLPLVMEPVDNLNIFIVSHAGVLKDFIGSGFYNNAGFIINTQYNSEEKSLSVKKYVLLNEFLQNSNFFTDYTNRMYNKDYYCPSNRCGQLCSVINSEPNVEIKQLHLQCDNA